MAKLHPLPSQFVLMRGSAVLATLKQCAPVEMFWLGCDFVRESTFADIESIYHEISNSPDTDEGVEMLALNIERLREMGVKLIDPADDTDIVDYIMHIEGDRVVLRFIDPRDED